MSDFLKIGRLELGGGILDIFVEEGRNFRRTTLVRSRLMFGEPQEVGRVYIYDVDSFIELIEKTRQVIKDIGEFGVVGAKERMKL